MIHSARHFRVARAALGWSQYEAAKEAEIGQMVISRVESRGPEGVQAKNLIKLAQAYERAGIVFGETGVGWAKMEQDPAPLTRPVAEEVAAT